MRIKTFTIIISAFILAFASCKKAPLTIGKTVVQNRELEPFDTLVINNDVNVTLVKSDSCYIEISAGENIIDNITTVVDDSILTIKNDNKISWIRTYDYRIDATLHFTDISKITSCGCGEIRTKNHFDAEESDYTIEVDGGSGDIFMELNNCDRLDVNYLYGTSQLNLYGENNKHLQIYKLDYGLIHAENYDTDSVLITNKSSGDCWVKANEHLKSRIEHLGNVYYKGEPEIVEEYGEDAKGRLIRLLGD